VQENDIEIYLRHRNDFLKSILQYEDYDDELLSLSNTIINLQNKNISFTKSWIDEYCLKMASEIRPDYIIKEKINLENLPIDNISIKDLVNSNPNLSNNEILAKLKEMRSQRNPPFKTNFDDDDILMRINDIRFKKSKLNPTQWIEQGNPPPTKRVVNEVSREEDYGRMKGNVKGRQSAADEANFRNIDEYLLDEGRSLSESASLWPTTKSGISHFFDNNNPMVEQHPVNGLPRHLDTSIRYVLSGEADKVKKAVEEHYEHHKKSKNPVVSGVVKPTGLGTNIKNVNTDEDKVQKNEIYHPFIGETSQNGGLNGSQLHAKSLEQFKMNNLDTEFDGRELDNLFEGTKKVSEMSDDEILKTHLMTWAEKSKSKDFIKPDKTYKEYLAAQGLGESEITKKVEDELRQDYVANGKQWPEDVKEQIAIVQNRLGEMHGDNHYHGVGFLTHALGIEFLSPQDRTTVFNHLMEHGTDNADKQVIQLSDGKLNMSYLKTQMMSRVIPALNHSQRAPNFAGPNLSAKFEDEKLKFKDKSRTLGFANHLLDNLIFTHDDARHPNYDEFNKGVMSQYLMDELGHDICRQDAENALTGDNNLSLSDLLEHHGINGYYQNGKMKKFTTENSFNQKYKDDRNLDGETWGQVALREKRAAVENNAIKWPSLSKTGIEFGNLNKKHIKEILNWADYYRKLDKTPAEMNLSEKTGKASPLWSAYTNWAEGKKAPHRNLNENAHANEVMERSGNKWKWNDMVNFLGFNEKTNEDGSITYSERGKHDMLPLRNTPYFTNKEMQAVKEHYEHSRSLSNKSKNIRNISKPFRIGSNGIRKEDLPKSEDGITEYGVDKGFLTSEKDENKLEGLGRMFHDIYDTRGGHGISDTQFLSILHDHHAHYVNKNAKVGEVYSKSIFGEKRRQSLDDINEQGKSQSFSSTLSPLMHNEKITGLISFLLPSNLPAGARIHKGVKDIMSLHGSSSIRTRKDENGNVTLSPGLNDKNDTDRISARHPDVINQGKRRDKFGDIDGGDAYFINTHGKNPHVLHDPYVVSNRVNSFISDGKINNLSKIKQILGMSHAMSHRGSDIVSDIRQKNDIGDFWGFDFGLHNNGKPNTFLKSKDILSPENIKKLKINTDIDESQLRELLALSTKVGRKEFADEIHDFTQSPINNQEIQQGTVEDIGSLLEQLKGEKLELETRRDSAGLSYEKFGSTQQDYDKGPLNDFSRTSAIYKPLNTSEKNRLKELDEEINHVQNQLNVIEDKHYSNSFSAEKNRFDHEEEGRVRDEHAKLDFAKEHLLPKVLENFPDAFNADVVGAHQVKINMAQLLHDAEIGLLTVPHKVHNLKSYGSVIGESESQTMQQLSKTGKGHHDDIQKIMSQHGVGLNDFGNDEYGNSNLTAQNLVEKLGLELNPDNLMYAQQLINSHIGKNNKVMTLGQLLSKHPNLSKIPKLDENGEQMIDENGEQIYEDTWDKTNNSKERQELLASHYRKASQAVPPTLEKIPKRDEFGNLVKDEEGNMVFDMQPKKISRGKLATGGSFDLHPNPTKVRNEHYRTHPIYNHIRDIHKKMNISPKSAQFDSLKNDYGLVYEKNGEIGSGMNVGKKQHKDNLHNMLDSVIVYDADYDEKLANPTDEKTITRPSFSQGEVEIHPHHEQKGRTLSTVYTGGGIAPIASTMTNSQANFAFNFTKGGNINIGNYATPRAHVPPPAGVYPYILGEEQHQMNTNVVLGDQTSAQIHENPQTSSQSDELVYADISHVAKAELPIEMPLIEPLHKIFKITDIEQLRGFTGEWVASIQEDGKRLKVKRTGNRITLTDGNAQRVDSYSEMDKYFRKITSKNYVIDVIMNDEGIFISDVMHYDGTDVTDLDTRDRMKLLRGQFESHNFIHVLGPSTLKITDEDGLENAVKDLLSDNKDKKILLRDAKSTYMKGEEKHPKWIMMTKSYDDYHIPFDMEIENEQFILHFADDIVKYDILDDGVLLDVLNPKSMLGELYDDNYPLTLAKSLEKYWQPAFRQMWKAEKKKRLTSKVDMNMPSKPNDKKIEVESAGIIDADDESRIMKPKGEQMLKTLELIARALDVLEKGHSNMAGRGLGIDVGAQIESPRGPTRLTSEESMPDWDMKERPTEDMEKPEKYPGRDKKMKISEENHEEIEEDLDTY